MRTRPPQGSWPVHQAVVASRHNEGAVAVEVHSRHRVRVRRNNLEALACRCPSKVEGMDATTRCSLLRGKHLWRVVIVLRTRLDVPDANAFVERPRHNEVRLRVVVDAEDVVSVAGQRLDILTLKPS